MHHIQHKDEGAGAPEIKGAIDQLKTVFEEFKAANDKRIDDLKKGMADVVTEEKVNRINDSITAQQKAIDDLIKKTALRTGGDEKKTGQTEYQKAFGAFVRKGDTSHVEKAINESPELKALSTSSDNNGGYLAPEQMDQEIGRVVANVSVVRGLSQVVQIGAASLKKPFNRGGSTSGWVGETESRPETQTPQLSILEFPVMEIYANPYATQSMLDDAYVNVEQWLQEEVAIEFAEQEGRAFVAGAGVASPRGLTAQNFVANASYAWGSVGYIASGASGAFASSNPGDAIFDLLYSLRQAYRPNATWLMNRTVEAAIRKFRDTTGQYLWQPSLQAGAPTSLLGYPIAVDDNMPDIAAGSHSLLFGDFRRAYIVVDRIGTRVLRDPFSAKPYVMFYTTKRVGGGVQNFEAYKAMRFAAS